MLRGVRHRAWLAAAVCLLALAAWLMSRGDSKARTAAKKPKVELPRYPRQDEWERSQRRRTIPLPPLASAEPDAPPVKRDPVLVALPRSPDKSTVVFEAGALRTSPVGKLFMDCFLDAKGEKDLRDLKEKAGIDVLEDVDRVAMSTEKVVVISGEFGDARLDGLLTDHDRRSFGQRGEIYEQEWGGAIGIWGGEIVVAAPNGKAIEEAFERLEGKRPAPPAIPEGQAFGDVYGMIAAEDAAKMIPDPALAERMREVAPQIELHVDAASDVGVVANVTGAKKDDVRDLGKSLGAAVSLARMEARRSGDDRLAELLELGRVAPGDGAFRMELGLPLPILERELGKCRKDRRGPLSGGPQDGSDTGAR
jgi:hypothetical protein